jgi:hypothetical protein
MTQAVALAQQASTGVSQGFKNRIINGAMVIDQRNAGASLTPSNGQYSLDRWKCWQAASSKFSVQQSTTVPTGFRNSIAVTSLSSYSVGADEYFAVAQLIEGFNVADLNWGTANAKTVTLSFQVRSSLTGTFGGAINNANLTRSYPFSYTISAANTWTTISVTLAGDTTGTWNTDNNGGVYVWFSLGSGANNVGTANTWAGAWYTAPTGSVSVVGTNAATWFVTGVQLEVGSTATSFDYLDYGRSLIQCQRYYESGSANPSCFADTFSNAVWEGFFKVDKRSSGTFTYNDGNGNTGKISRWFTGSYSDNVTPSGLSSDGTKRFSGNIASLSPGTLVKVGFNWFQNSEL